MICHICGRTFTNRVRLYTHPCTPPQLDLFGQVEAAAEARTTADLDRLRGGLLALRDDVPDAMHVLVHLKQWRDREDRSIGLSGVNDAGPRVAYSIRNAGLHYEPSETWGGWNTCPANLVTWDELHDLLADDPRRPALIAWYDAVPAMQQWTTPDGAMEYRARWRDHTRPHELARDPDGWHPSYIDHDHTAPGWTARLAAWHTLQAILTDAAEALA